MDPKLLPEISSVITGASRVSQVYENLKAAEVKAKLTPEVLARIEEILGIIQTYPIKTSSLAPRKPRAKTEILLVTLPGTPQHFYSS